MLPVEKISSACRKSDARSDTRTDVAFAQLDDALARNAIKKGAVRYRREDPPFLTMKTLAVASSATFPLPSVTRAFWNPLALASSRIMRALFA